MLVIIIIIIHTCIINTDNLKPVLPLYIGTPNKTEIIVRVFILYKYPRRFKCIIFHTFTFITLIKMYIILLYSSKCIMYNMRRIISLRINSFYISASYTRILNRYFVYYYNKLNKKKKNVIITMQRE